LGQDARVQVTTSIVETRAVLAAARDRGLTIGLVPTMGYLHRGHLSLMTRARADCGLVVLSIFVNPLQFGAGDDLSTYPRDLPGDMAAAEAAGVDVVFTPDVAEMYSRPAATSVAVADLAATMEGATRPTHFTGVATVVAKLFNIVGPCRAYFGEKDFQQLTIVRRMVADLSFPVEVVGCPIVREPDGLALSSRNVYLNAEERETAPVLHRALQAGVASILAGERDPDAVRDLMAAIVAGEPLADLDYAEVVAAADLARLDVLAGEVRLLVAARLGRARLLDNLGVLVPEQG
jgi:pantoate--beta-alanine ligase